jgi:hypothetical protein
MRGCAEAGCSLWAVIYCPPFIICRLLSAVRRLPSAVRRLPSAVRRLPSAVCGLPSAVHIKHYKTFTRRS